MFITTTNRIEFEKKTVTKMVGFYCKKRHRPEDGLCPDCASLLEYSHKRLDKCVYQNDKPTCSKCTIHCYKPGMRQQIRDVMRYSQPRMLIRQPHLVILHAIEGFLNKFNKKHKKKGKESPPNVS
ncbi:MAG: nitrous oxide-stimulated promoter family protein [Nitrospirae bacterium]|nr:nitrous oxide-stimulated promoter family protein [Nitrospirota bacterium]